jgi:hypothetical protein
LIRDPAAKVKFVGFDLPLNHVWVAMAILTLLHLYYS